MLGLSAKTYSFGVDGSRYGGGVSDSFLKYLAIPTGSSMAMAASSSVGGADESEERSESEGAMIDVVGEGDVKDKSLEPAQQASRR